MLLVGGIAWIGGGIRGDGGDRRERTSLDRTWLSSRRNRRHAGHGQGVPAPGLKRINIIQWSKRVSKSQAGFLAEFRTVKCKQRRVRSAVGQGSRWYFCLGIDKKKWLKFGMTRIEYVDK
jgi:hypothetical protein